LKTAVLEQILPINVSYTIIKVYIIISLALNILLVRANYEILCIFYASRRKYVGNAAFQAASILLLTAIFFGGFWVPFCGSGFSRDIESIFNHKDESGLELESLKYLKWLVAIHLSFAWAPFVFLAAFSKEQSETGSSEKNKVQIR
jgi:hypothetical protein